MFVKKLIKDDGQADLIVTDGQYDIMCCCWEYNPLQKDNQQVKEISSLFTTDIMRVDDHDYLVQKIHGKGEHYSYHLQGRVIDKSKPLISIGELKIELDRPLPKDINVGEFVEFKVGRLDCFV